MNRIVAIILVVLALAGAGGVAWLASAPLAPPTETVERQIPDDHIPR